MGVRDVEQLPLGKELDVEDKRSLLVLYTNHHKGIFVNKKPFWDELSDLFFNY